MQDDSEKEYERKYAEPGSDEYRVWLMQQKRKKRKEREEEPETEE